MGATKSSRKGLKAAVRAAVRSKGKGAEPTERADQPIDELILSTVNRILRNFTATMSETKNGKLAIGDFIKLVTFQREMEDSRPKEVCVRWVEQSTE